MRYLMLILFLQYVSCSTRSNDVIIENKNSMLVHKYQGKIKNPYKELVNFLNNKDSLRGYKIKFKNTKDNTIVNLIDTIKLDYNASYQINISRIERNPTNLICNKKLIINSKQMTFIFCYDNVISFLNEKKKSDIYFSNYDKIINLISVDNPKPIKLDLNIVISELIKYIPFEVIDNLNDLKISKIVIEDFSTLSSRGNYHYILDNKNDTIAYFGFKTYFN